VRLYTFRVAGGLPALERALSTLGSLSRSFQDGSIRTVRLEHVKVGSAHLEALVRVSCKIGGQRLWSDLYRLVFREQGSAVVAAVHHISGVGRTDPDFLIDLLLKLAAAGDTGP